VREKFHRTVENLNKENFKLVNEDDYDEFLSYYGPWHDTSRGPQKRASQQPWYKDCIKYNAAKLGLIEMDEDALDALLVDIDDNIPDVLCERVTDEIKEIDILDPEVIKRTLDLIEYYSPVASMIKNISGGYYGDNSEKEENAKRIGILCKVLNENPDIMENWDFPNYLGEVKDDE
jgi:hypothetical protein